MFLNTHWVRQTKNILTAEYESHLFESKRRYNMKSEDTKMSKTTATHKVLTGDLQKCLPTPLLTNCISFYKVKQGVEVRKYHQLFFNGLTVTSLKDTHIWRPTPSMHNRKKKEEMNNITILTPWDLQQMVRQCSSSYHMHNMEQVDFMQFTSLFSGRSAPFIYRKINIEKENVLSQLVFKFKCGRRTLV
ncbi:hypothetical protein PR048_012439 [Dryococelus australis]|uniref:Uncharacterized protein n=1 Tax=Dryococelus australis TaxID=614101 RepID=A0ABQ9HPD6_9NEOP|nr:hypothetical protein PR048_012439 [Dryococelus australis]